MGFIKELQKSGGSRVGGLKDFFTRISESNKRSSGGDSDFFSAIRSMFSGVADEDNPLAGLKKKKLG